MKLLLHICCAPCAIYPLRLLREQGHDVYGLFYNPNIHPYSEYMKRFEAVKEYAEQVNLKIITSNDYAMEEFLRNVVFRESDRCRYCYYDRLRETARIARKGIFEGFTTTLLYSKFQKHEAISEIGQSLAISTRVRFYYQDFRDGWKEGIEKSREMGMYRQQYCGCIYSEKDRFYKNRKTLI